MIKNLATFLIRVVLDIFFRTEIRGIENIPVNGKVIVASNHISNIDPPAILSYINKYRNDTAVLAKKELFKNPLLGAFLRKMGAIEVDRRKADITAFKKSIRALEEGKLLLIFPEGTRRKENKEIKPKSGISFLAKKTKAPILPVKIASVKNGLKLSKIIIVFDKPIETGMYNFDDENVFQEFPKVIMEKICSIKI
jgi:1-acyl-sn-glycerol-3-phosphate acyltransferase